MLKDTDPPNPAELKYLEWSHNNLYHKDDYELRKYCPTCNPKSIKQSLNPFHKKLNSIRVGTKSYKHTLALAWQQDQQRAALENSKEIMRGFSYD